MKKENKKFLEQATKIVEGADGFVIIGIKTPKGFAGGAVGQNISRAEMVSVFLEATDIDPTLLGVKLLSMSVKAEIGKKIAKKKAVSKKKVAKRG